MAFPTTVDTSAGPRGLPGKWTDSSRCHRSTRTGGFPAATFAGTCKAMIAQRRGRVSFCCAGRTSSPGEDHCFTPSAQDHSSFNRSVLLLSSPSFQAFSFNISRVSPGTVRADLAHGGGARSTVRQVKVAVGSLSSLPQRIGKGAGRQRLHIFSGRQKLRMPQSSTAGVPWVQLTCWPAAWIFVDKYGGWNSQRGSLYTGDGNEPPQQSFLGGQSVACRGRLRRRGLQV